MSLLSLKRVRIPPMGAIRPRTAWKASGHSAAAYMNGDARKPRSRACPGIVSKISSIASVGGCPAVSCLATSQ
ncbi:hypothetical protein HNR72_000743 [Streptomyces collinus]|uniref:Uncharacterized protein n=1 Tax=Streptomyces collinus TaxID=42684 RepID=A0AA89PYL9_STRCU|nr:hypothetical protein [Streptomyces collinus]